MLTNWVRRRQFLRFRYAEYVKNLCGIFQSEYKKHCVTWSGCRRESDLIGELLYVPIKSMSHLRKLVQMRENLILGSGGKRVAKTQGSRIASYESRIAEIGDQTEGANGNELSVDAIQAPKKVYQCWNCDIEGQGWDMCLGGQRDFCYGCGEKNTYKLKCPVCIAKISEHLAAGSIGI